MEEMKALRFFRGGLIRQCMQQTRVADFRDCCRVASRDAVFFPAVFARGIEFTPIPGTGKFKEELQIILHR